jgi:hypothetical protein
MKQKDQKLSKLYTISEQYEYSNSEDQLKNNFDSKNVVIKIVSSSISRRRKNVQTCEVSTQTIFQQENLNESIQAKFEDSRKYTSFKKKISSNLSKTGKAADESPQSRTSQKSVVDSYFN